ncbi:MAG: riboflavin synthase [Ginsengibacter sp.]
MFTGIVESIGILHEITERESNKTFYIKSELAPQFRVDESICHNGVCLTVEAISEDIYQVTAIKETLEKSNLGDWKRGDLINLERSMMMNSRLDGHIVQGHVDGTAACLERTDRAGSFQFDFEFDKKFAALVIEKGSICLNGISLTVFNLGANTFSVAIIPYTFSHTNMQYLQKGMKVNVEFDLIGKYVNRLQSLQ